jgi:hypothetical protein
MLTSPRLVEVSLRADQLLQLTAMGQQALQYIAGEQKVPANWKASQIHTLDEVGKPSALVRFVFLPGITDLVKAVRE